MPHSLPRVRITSLENAQVSVPPFPFHSISFHLQCSSPHSFVPGCLLVSIPAACLFAPSVPEREQLLRAFLQSYDPPDLALQRRAIRRRLRQKDEELNSSREAQQEEGEGHEAGSLKEEYAQVDDGE